MLIYSTVCEPSYYCRHSAKNIIRTQNTLRKCILQHPAEHFAAADTRKNKKNSWYHAYRITALISLKTRKWITLDEISGGKCGSQTILFVFWIQMFRVFFPLTNLSAQRLSSRERTYARLPSRYQVNTSRNPRLQVWLALGVRFLILNLNPHWLRGHGTSRSSFGKGTDLANWVGRLSYSKMKRTNWGQKNISLEKLGRQI